MKGPDYIKRFITFHLSKNYKNVDIVVKTVKPIKFTIMKKTVKYQTQNKKK